MLVGSPWSDAVPERVTPQVVTIAQDDAVSDTTAGTEDEPTFVRLPVAGKSLAKSMAWGSSNPYEIWPDGTWPKERLSENMPLADDDMIFRELFAPFETSVHKKGEEADQCTASTDETARKVARRTYILEPACEDGTDRHLRGSHLGHTPTDGSIRLSCTGESVTETVVHEPRDRSRFGRGSVRPSFANVGNILSDLRAIIHGEILVAHPAVKEIYNSAHKVKLRDSVWDAALFIFYRPLGTRTNLCVVLPVVLTIFLQVSFLLCRRSLYREGSGIARDVGGVIYELAPCQCSRIGGGLYRGCIVDHKFQAGEHI